jgi:hypothetical protein
VGPALAVRSKRNGRLTRGAGPGSGPTWRWFSFGNGQRLFFSTAFQILVDGGAVRGSTTRVAHAARILMRGMDGCDGWFPVTEWLGCRRTRKAVSLLRCGTASSVATGVASRDWVCQSWRFDGPMSGLRKRDPKASFSSVKWVEKHCIRIPIAFHLYLVKIIQILTN